MRILSCGAAVVGAGAAGMNAADELLKAGVDALVVADSLSGGTSRNAGSDKQTYYKLSLAGDAPDSVGSLARSFYGGGGMHGDHALALAANSAACFLKLAGLGVPFPHNEWGEYVGYRTDHDAGGRAISAGPLTSAMMADALTRSAMARGARMEGGLSLASILTDDRGRARGLAMIDEAGELVLVNANAILLCTGGPRAIYGRVAFPDAQLGATGAALRAGAASSNLCYWQYGLASTKVKWNVSGSFQQAVPAYTDGEGEFLPLHFDGRADMLSSVFLKGYQWPFDSRKLGGSSRVDRAVQGLCGRGGCAYLDFRRDPSGGIGGIGGEAEAYLRNCGAVGDTPLARLLAMNPDAYGFYLSRGIDLAREPLEIAVCAQHSNGGLKIDRWWRTTVEGLYAAGECAGAFGVYRPGGSALNETQVGSMRAARHIASAVGARKPPSEGEFRSLVERSLESEIGFLRAADGTGETDSPVEAFAGRMDACAGAMRSVAGMGSLLRDVEAAIREGRYGDGALRAIRSRDALHVMRDALAAMIEQSRFEGDAGHGFTDRGETRGEPAGAYVFEASGGVAKAVPIRPLPEGGGWFEEVWRRFREGAVFGDAPEGIA